MPADLDGMVSGDGPAGLLAAAAALGVWRMAGAASDGTRFEPVEGVDDPWPECSDAAAARLELLMTGFWPDVLRLEWCRLAAAANVRAPAGLTPLLQGHFQALGRNDALHAVLGARRGWLAALNPAELAPPAEDWAGADAASRARALRTLREADPDAARDVLLAVWPSELAEVRLRFLSVLQHGVGDADEPFLESCLDDRSGPVRAEAARLLGYLPGSGHAVRMQARAQAAVRLRSGWLRNTLEVTLPDADKPGRRDGLAVVAGQAGQGAKLLRQVVAAAPLASWDGQTPAAWLAAALAGDWAVDLMTAWAAAAVRERSGPWLQALMEAMRDDAAKVPFPFNDAFEIVAKAVAPHEVEAFVTAVLRQSGIDPAQFMLGLCEHQWSAGFTVASIAWLDRLFSPGGPMHDKGYRLRLNLDDTAFHADPEAAAGPLAALVDRLPEDLRRSVGKMAETLRFRAAMRQELAPQ